VNYNLDEIAYYMPRGDRGGQRILFSRTGLHR